MVGNEPEVDVEMGQRRLAEEPVNNNTMSGEQS